jgi:hypothetical protein
VTRGQPGVRLLPRRTALPLLVRHPRAFASRYRWALLVLLAGAVADAVTTFHNLRIYGPAVEVHPAHRFVYELLPPAVGAPVAKALQLGFVLFVAAWWRPWCGALLAGCGLLYTLAALSNHFQLL